MTKTDLTAAFEFARREGLEFLPLRIKGEGAGKAPIEKGWIVKKYTEVDIPAGANLGFKCGTPSRGLVVLDFDIPEHYSATFSPEKIEKDTTVVQTGKGFHVYFRVDGAFRSRAFKMRRGGIEYTFSVQGGDKLVVAPGSQHLKTGKKYSFKSSGCIAQVSREGMEALIARAETKILELGYEIVTGQEAFDIQEVLSTPPRIGSWSDFKTFRVATFCRMAGLSEEVTLEVLLAWWKGSPDFGPTTPGWVGQKVESAWRPEEPYHFKFFQDPLTVRVEDKKLIFTESISVSLLQAIAAAKEGEYGFDPGPVAEAILELHHFKAMSDSKELLVYNQGVYSPQGEIVVEREVARLLKRAGKRATREKVGEVVAAVRRSSYVDRASFMAPVELLCVENGVLNLRTRELMPHSPELLFVTKIPVTYNPDAKCPRIMEFMGQVHHPADICVAQEAFGYGLWRNYFIQKAIMFLGGGHNGKGTWLGIYRAFLGAENCSAWTLQDLASNKFATAELCGKLANISPDLPASKLRDAGKFKALTGGDLVTGERKGQAPFRFVNYAKLLFSANQLPEVGDNSDAFFRRWIILNFPNTFTEIKSRDEFLGELTTPEELSGLLNWSLAGLQRLHTEGKFTGSLSTDVIREDYIRKSNPQAGFFQDCIEVSLEATISKRELYELYAVYCDSNALPKVSPPVFARDHLPLYVPSARSVRIGGKGKQQPAWQGIQLKEGCALGPSLPSTSTLTTTLDGSNQILDPHYQNTGPGEGGVDSGGSEGIRGPRLPGQGGVNKDYCNSPDNGKKEGKKGEETKGESIGVEGVGAKTLATLDTHDTTLPQSQRNPLVYNTIRNLIREAKKDSTFIPLIVSELRGLLPEAETHNALHQLEHEGRIIVTNGEVRLV